MLSAIEWSRGWIFAVPTVLLGLLVTAPPIHAAAPERGRFLRVTASTGIDFSTGDFGTDADTDVFYVPTSLKVEWDPLFLKVTVPFVFVDGDAVLIDGQPVGIPAFVGSRSGIGDVVIAAGYGYFPDGGVIPAVELSGKIKIGTADEDQGLGTGEEDYTIQLDLSKNLGRITPFAAVGYRFIGDPPEVKFNDKVFASAGLSLSLGRRFSMGLAYDWAQSAVPGSPDIQEIAPFGSIKLSEHFAVDPYAVIGLSNSSPDWGLGTQLRVFWQRD